jgi:hypothetical protein
MIDRHRGHLARDRGDHVIRLSTSSIPRGGRSWSPGGRSAASMYPSRTRARCWLCKRRLAAHLPLPFRSRRESRRLRAAVAENIDSRSHTTVWLYECGSPSTTTASSAHSVTPQRRDIVRGAIDGHEGVVELAAHYPMSFQAVQKHVAILERAGLVSKHRSRRRKVVSSL